MQLLEKNRGSKNKFSQLQLSKTETGEMTTSSMNGAGKTVLPRVEKQN